MFDFLDFAGEGDWFSDLGNYADVDNVASAATDFSDYADTAGDVFGGQSAAEMFGSYFGGEDLAETLGSGFYGTDEQSIVDLLGTGNLQDGVAGMDFEPSQFTDMIAGAATNPDGTTGIPWIDKIIKNLGDRFEKDPLSMIGSGVGILGILDKLRKGQSGGIAGGRANHDTSGVDALWAGRNSGPFDGANAAPNMGTVGAQAQSLVNPNASQMIPIVNNPTVRDPGLFVTSAPIGALSKLKR